jgi:hypothetical protein
MAVLQEKEIYFRNFSIENNVFIKDLFSDPNNMGHWIYNINDIDFYVPNFGHLVVIDSRFADVNPPNIPQSTRGVLYKIISPTLFLNNGINVPFDIKLEILNDFKRIIDRNNFTQNGQYNDYGMIVPDIETLNLIDRMNNNTNINIKDIIEECFPEYVHNRVGTLLTRTEKDTISLNVTPKFNPGKLIVYQSRYDEYTWAIYKKDVNGKKKEILIKDNTGNLYTKQVFAHSLLEHSESNNVMQISEKNFRLNKDSLIESYKLL